MSKERGVKKCQNLTFKVNFSMSKIIQIFLFFFSLNNISTVAHFFVIAIFDRFNFSITLFSKMMPNFYTNPLNKFSKFNNFLWVCYFLGKNLSNLYPPFENSTPRIATLPLLSTFLKILVASSLNFLLEQINGYCPDPFSLLRIILPKS